MSRNAWLDISVFRCPRCGHHYADVSWYVVELESDIECGSCHESFNARKQLMDRVMLEFKIGEKGKVFEAGVVEHVSDNSVGS